MRFIKRAFLGIFTFAGLLMIPLGILGYGVLFAVPTQYDENFYTPGAEDSPADFDDQPYFRMLQKYVNARGQVNYGSLAEDRSDLDQYVHSAAFVTEDQYDQWSCDERMAFWINTYNALTIKVVADRYPISPPVLLELLHPDGIRRIPGVWDKIQFLVIGKKMTLQEIKDDVLRKFGDPRIHMAIVDAACGGPPLRTEPYRGETLHVQLDQQVRRFLSTPEGLQIDADSNVVRVSSIFSWFAEDFFKITDDSSDSTQCCIDFITQALDSPKTQVLRDNPSETGYLPFDWSLNRQ